MSYLTLLFDLGGCPATHLAIISDMALLGSLITLRCWMGYVALPFYMGHGDASKESQVFSLRTGRFDWHSSASDHEALQGDISLIR